MTSSEWHLVYDLARDDERTRRIQEASLTRPGYGFPIKPALLGSPEWWGLIEQGVLPEVSVEGSIERVYWATGSMGDWAEVTLRHDDAADPWTRECDVRRYVEGLGARVHYVELEAKPDAPFAALDPVSKVVLRIWIEASTHWSPAIAPGPGGVGYRLAGAPGTHLPLHLPGGQPARPDHANLRRHGSGNRRPAIVGRVGAHVRVTDRRTNERTERRRQAVSAIAGEYNGVYDGFDLIEEGSCRSEGP